MQSRISLLVLGLLMTASSAPAQSLKISLDGPWQFRADSLKAGLTEGWALESFDRSSWQVVAAPSFWESYPGLATYDGWGWFARSFVLPRTNVPLSVVFAGVDDEATVWVNGLEVGTHAGYSDPFVVDIGAAVREGENSIVLLVRDSGGGGGLYRPVTIVPTSGVDELLRSPAASMQALKSAPWVRDAVLYCIDVRVFTPEGTFAALEKRIGELKDLGVSVLWLMPIHPIGLTNRKGTYGSPYSVRDYYAVNPEFGTMAQFKSLLAAVHRSGMRLVLDLVANHTAWDSRLIREHPEWFTKNVSGAIIPPNADWTDVADLDYSKPGLRQYMTDMMVWWIRDVGIDGFRCDVAELVPTEFWNDARARLNRIKPVLMLAEGSLPEHHLKAFDLSYSWNIYDALDGLLRGSRSVRVIDQILQSERLQFPVGSLRMRFTTNHDKNFYDAPAVEKFGFDGLALANVLTSTLPGIPMVYNGEEIPNDRRINHHERSPILWKKPYRMAPLFQKLFALRALHPALRHGQMLAVPSSAPDSVYAFIRAAGNDRVLVVLNFCSASLNIRLDVPVATILPRQKSAVLEDLLGGTRVSVSTDELQGYVLTLPGHGYALRAIR
jgi:glycosidase